MFLALDCIIMPQVECYYLLRRSLTSPSSLPPSTLPTVAPHLGPPPGLFVGLTGESGPGLPSARSYWMLDRPALARCSGE